MPACTYNIPKTHTNTIDFIQNERERGEGRKQSSFKWPFGKLE